MRDRSGVWIGLGLSVFLFCYGCASSSDDPTQQPDACAGHCSNGYIDLTCGETGRDCGGTCGSCSTASIFKTVLFDAPSTLTVSVESLDLGTGLVTINGADSSSPDQPFEFAWGDGAVTSGWLPQSHVYSDTSTNYTVTVVAHYANGTQGIANVLARFVPPSITPVTLPSTLLVTIPREPVRLRTRLYSPPPELGAFNDSHFQIVTRKQIEYVLSVAATLQHGFANQNVFLVDNAFNQVVLRDPAAGGMQSLWFTSPVAFACAEYGFSGTFQYSSFFHEMGHNVSLNSPANHCFGGRIDGNANAIYSETMAQVFQHATTHTLLNGDHYGLSADLLFDIEQSAIMSMRIVRSFYDNYRHDGMPYTSWNDPATPDDETIGTFMTIAYKFFEQAEIRATGYRAPLKRMMALLQTFDADLEDHYDRDNNTADANVFRSTLMVAAVSYAFDADLRADFRELKFPVDDVTYTALLARP